MAGVPAAKLLLLFAALRPSMAVANAGAICGRAGAKLAAIAPIDAAYDGRAAKAKDGP
jgi:hypothetical protein